MRTLMLLLLFLPALAWGTDYYVAPSGGSDSNPCTQAAPCASFSTLLAKLHPGDRGLLKGGTYTQALKVGNPPVRPGTPAAPITLASAPGETATVAPTGTEAVTINGNTQYWVLEDLIIDGSKLGHPESATNGVSVNWRSGPQHSPQATSHITLRRLTIRNVTNPLGANGIGMSVFADDNQIEHVTIDGTHLQPGDRQGSHGIYLNGHRNRIVGGLVRHTGGCGIQLNDSGHHPDGNADNVVIGVWLESNGHRRSGATCGITVYHNMQRTRVVSNVIVGTVRGAGLLHEGGNNTGSVIAHNTIVGNAGACVTGGSDVNHPSTVTTLQNNICWGNGSGIILGPTATDASVVTNVLTDHTPPASSAGDTAASGNLVGVDPQFVDAAAGNYRLMPTSPACGAGQPLVAVQRNAWGQAYGSPPDIGVFPCTQHPEPGPDPPQPPSGPVVLTCTGHLASVPGMVRVVCTHQEATTP